MKKDDKSKKIGKEIKNICYTTALIFIALRSADVIQWEWYWLLMPIFAKWAIGILLLILVGSVAVAEAKKKGNSNDA